MPAYLKDISTRKCRTCGLRATKTLMNTYNAEVGDYCTRHAERALAETQKKEEQARREAQQRAMDQ